jgi:hypothetical protein
LCAALFSVPSAPPIHAQTHTSVSLESHVYHILEQAELRGLCAPLSGVRPYTRGVVAKAINEILDHESTGRLRGAEAEILREYLAKFSTPSRGIDWRRGLFYGETPIGRNETIISYNIGVGIDTEFSAGFYPAPDKMFFGTELWISVDFSGDIGSHVSYGLYNEGGLVKAPRRFLGTYNTYYEGFDMGSDSEYANRVLDVYSEPLTHFPFTYKKRWDSSVYFFDSLSGYRYWPDTVAGAYNFQGELSASFWEDRLTIRLGRLPREWGSMPFGSSLAFNGMARPFLAAETEFSPFSWLSMASLTGILEYENTEGIKISSMTNQNAFSIAMLKFRFKNYVFFDFIDSVVWPKRLELGYIAPITNTFFYQGNIGDFDNMAMSFNLKAQWPGIGSVWGSFFMDEINLLSEMRTLDRTMIAWQGGLNVPIPGLAFSSLRFSYTKINPYTYAHNRNFNPWYGDLRMETAYTNNGVSLGYYLPPNSDEFLVQLRSVPATGISAVLQYQAIRRGANFGSSAVDGSSLLSELDPENRDGNPVLKRFFLRDGAYQWMHIVKVGADWKLPSLPVSLFGEAGVVFSYFTDIDAPANVTGQAHSYRKVNTAEYPQSTSFVVKIGLRVFP